MYLALPPTLTCSRFSLASVIAASSHPLFLSQKYVQDVLREQLSETVYRYLREEGGNIYVCGDVTMAGDVLKTIQQIIKLHGNMSLEDAGFYISKLRVRHASDCWFLITVSPLKIIGSNILTALFNSCEMITSTECMMESCLGA